MSKTPGATLYIGNLDERVDERTLYEIMVQAGPLVEIHMPRDKDTKRHKSYAFAEYETKESAEYALSLFSGLVSLYNRSVKFARSGNDKQAKNSDAEKTLPPRFTTTPRPTNIQSPYQQPGPFRPANSHL